MQAADTTIVYICSPDRYRQLSFSLSTLLTSGTRFARAVVFCVGDDPGWRFGDERVRVRPVPSLYDDYFYGNKLYVCDVEADRVVFLDADTFVFSPIDRIWFERPASVIARVASAYGSPAWNDIVWRDACSRYGEKTIPLFNSGFVIFQNGSNRRLKPVWKEVIELYRGGAIRPPCEDRMSDQYGLSLAVLAGKLSYAVMSPADHTYGWIEPAASSDTVVFHTANSLFEMYLARFRIERPIWLSG
jgi:hypothetical protein